MAEQTDHLGRLALVLGGLHALGLQPVLVGGMALVILGSRRVTRDFDFVVADLGDRVGPVLDVFYDQGLELASRLDAGGNVTTTIDNRRMAAIRLRLDKPASASFLNPRSGLRVDLLFDFPLPAAELLRSATRLKVRGHSFLLASEADLLRLKRIAAKARSMPGDADDIAFLESRRPEPTAE